MSLPDTVSAEFFMDSPPLTEKRDGRESDYMEARSTRSGEKYRDDDRLDADQAESFLWPPKSDRSAAGSERKRPQDENEVNDWERFLR
jgi:hypothetical protein